VLTLVAVVAAVVAVGRSRADTNGPPGPERGAPLLVMLAPALVGLLIASEVVSDEWYAFTAIAIAFPLMLVWRPMYLRWQDRRASHHA
jgi:hypothetical protein